jgi:hypothetical protein
MARSVWVAFAAVVALTAHADGTGLKPGLWEVRIVKQVVDGRDLSAQMAGLNDKMQQAMASMPPQQRAQMEAMMKQRGAGMGHDGSSRMCVSPEMARRDRPVVDREGRCQPATVTRSGNHATFEFSCTIDGDTTTGKGSSTTGADLISTQVDMKTRKANGETHVTQTETEMRFVGSDCGSVKPPELPKQER